MLRAFAFCGATMDRVRKLADGGRKLDTGIRYVGQGKASTLVEARAAWRTWYHTSRWRRLRWEVLARDLFTCQYCKALFVDTSRLVADHITPHRGIERLFWDASNLQCLCAFCHSGAKQREEGGGGPM